MPQIAMFVLILAACCALYAVIAASIAVRAKNAVWLESALHALQALSGLLTLAVLLLLYFLMARDFRMPYVVNYSNLTLSPIYVVSALWAGQEGSLLFWAWMLSVCSVLFSRHARNRMVCEAYSFPSLSRSLQRQLPRQFSAELSYAIVALAVVLGFFLLQVLVFSNPFLVSEHVPLDGRGMNPLLQTPYMAAHPPVLFIGYAGFAIPCALAFATLCCGNMSKGAVADMRRWTLFSWYFLGMGILLGAHWAYLELGWGGYWGWDPVENASFIPWVSSTALLHTLLLQQRKGSLKRWNLFLSVITFLLCIFGTFITRSHLLSSVHAYAESPAAIGFLLFIVMLLGIFVALSILRWKRFQSRETAADQISKDGSFLLSAQVFMGLGVAVLYGTLYPALTEVLTGKQRIIGVSFFNRVSVPLGLVLLALMGICQALPWKALSLQEFFTRLRLPVVLAALAGLGLAALGLRQWDVLLTCSLGVLVLTSLLLCSKHRLRPVTFFHFGTAVLCVGIAVSSGYKREFQTELRPGESFEGGNFRFHYREKRIEEREEMAAVIAVVDVYRNEKFLSRLAPEKRFYRSSNPDDPIVTTEVGLYSSLRTDVYSILAGWDEEDLTSFTFILSPMILWIWIGGFVMVTLGILLYVRGIR